MMLGDLQCQLRAAKNRGRFKMRVRILELKDGDRRKGKVLSPAGRKTLIQSTTSVKGFHHHFIGGIPLHSLLEPHLSALTLDSLA